VIVEAVAALSASDRAEQAFTVWSPGRVNLIGDHIDYSGGLVLPMALDRGTRAVVVPRTDRAVRGCSSSFPGVVEANLDDLGFDPAHRWFSYVLGVVATAMSRSVDIEHGFDIYLDGNIPRGGGLSSSASVEMAVAVALEHMFDPGLSPTQWALVAQEAENDYIGVACGIMDQLSIAVGRAGRAILMDCETLECDYVPMPVDSCSVLVASTNHPRSLADSAYNERRAAVERARVLIEDRVGRPVPRLVEATREDLDAARAVLEREGVLARARHTVTEQERVRAAAAALAAGDLPGLGRLMRESHESLRDDFEVTGEHLDALAEAAWATPGVVGARMTGAGFGGCTVNIVDKGAEDSVAAALVERYSAATGIRPDVYRVQPADGAGVVAAGDG
jgi:galactokinase